MLKRSSRSSFMPNAFVFPGGVVSSQDFSKVSVKVHLLKDEKLSIKRSKEGQKTRGSFMPNAFVFPGGVVSSQDFSKVSVNVHLLNMKSHTPKGQKVKS